MTSARVNPASGPRPVAELASEILRRGRGLRIKARGGSMTPALRDGDVALVTPTSGADLRVGDVVCFETVPGQLFLHRVVERRGAQMVARGDALLSGAVVEGHQVLGKVVAIERRGRLRRLDSRPARLQNRVMAMLAPLISRLVLVAIGSRRLRLARARG